MTDTITTPMGSPISSPMATPADETVMALMDAVNQARILLASDEHRSDLTEMAKISNDILALKARYDELQAAIDTRNKVYTDAEEALGGHLAAKHRVPSHKAENAVSGDPEPFVRVRLKPDAHHASNCSIFFDEPCDCQ